MIIVFLSHFTARSSIYSLHLWSSFAFGMSSFGWTSRRSCVGFRSRFALQSRELGEYVLNYYDKMFLLTLRLIGDSRNLAMIKNQAKFTLYNWHDVMLTELLNQALKIQHILGE